MTKDELAVLGALLAVVVGWSLNEFSHFLGRGREKKGAAGRALVELMELRHYIRGINLLFAELGRRTPISSADALAILKWADQILPTDSNLPDRYEKAVTELAGSDPVLAYRLRSKDQILPVLAKLRAIQISDPSFPDLLYANDKFLREKGLLALEKEIRALAWDFGVITWLRVLVMLSRKAELPADVIAYIDGLIAEQARRGSAG